MNTRTLVIAAFVVVILGAGFIVLTRRPDTVLAPSGPISSTSSGTNSTPVSTSPSIVIQNYAFSPAAIKVKRGEVVTVINKNNVSHTLTADNGSFDTGVLLKDQSGQFTAPSQPGVYPYHCTLHQPMKGTLTVE